VGEAASAAERYSRALDALAGGMPHAFVVATSLEPLDLRVASNHGTEVIRALLNQTLRALPGGASQISDGFHTFDELYDHRRALTAALARVLPSWRSKAHHPDDDPMFEGGYFIVGINLPTGTITYHYKLKHWDDFSGVEEREHAPRWDGAGPPESVTRLLEWARAVAGARQARS
jgi:hypothetical protein